MPHFPLEPHFDALRQALGEPGARVAVTLHFEFADSFVEAHVLNYDRLVITFEDASHLGFRPDRYRQGWGVTPFLRRGISVLAVKPKWRSWYGSRALPDGLMRLQPFLARFSEILHYGNSMGGFGALTYAGITGARRVVALAPQTTYRAFESGHDTRYPVALEKSQDDRFADAAQGCRAAEVWVFYDPMVPEDRWHAARLTGPGRHHVPIPFSGHYVPTLLQGVGALHLPVETLLTGQLDRPALYRHLRKRREVPVYHDALRLHAEAHPSAQVRLNRLSLAKPGLAPSKNDAFASQTE